MSRVGPTPRAPSDQHEYRVTIRIDDLSDPAESFELFVPRGRGAEVKADAHVPAFPAPIGLRSDYVIAPDYVLRQMEVRP